MLCVFVVFWVEHNNNNRSIREKRKKLDDTFSELIRFRSSSFDSSIVVLRSTSSGDASLHPNHRQRSIFINNAFPIED
jgi:hypothetical protein